MLNQKIILEETLKTDHLSDFGGLQSPNVDENNENYNQVMNVIKGYDAPSEQNKVVSGDQQQNDNNTGSSALRLTAKTDSFKVQQLELNESREYHSFLSDDDIQVDIDENEVKKMEECQKGNDVDFETCNHDEPNDSCEVDEELQNRINEVIMIPNTTRHISIQPRMDLKELDAKTMSNMYNLPEKTFKNPFLKFNKEEVTPLSVFEGFLKKKTLNVIPTWQNRYFVLENKKLFYYKTKEKGLISGCLDFDLISIKIEVLNGNSFKIIPEKAKRAFVLKAENKEESTKWIQALEEHRRRSKGGKSSITVGVNLKKFWKHDRISPSDFLDQVDTGDLLLFKTKHPNAKIQRSFTGSDYDHVAILLKYMSGEIVLFEAASKNGVSLCRWKTFLLNDWKKLYARIMYRKLCMKRKDDIITSIEDFVKATVGKKYKVNLTKLFKKKVAVGEEENKKNRTFFCSELVAAFYKKINVLAADAASCGFLPGSFSSEKKIQLLNDAYFEHEKMIDFSLEEEIFGKL